MNFKKWVFKNIDKELVSQIADELNLDPFVVFIAVSRGMTDPYEIERFFAKEPEFSDPYEYSGISDAVDRINIAIQSNEKILVFGDYDCDGVTATALLTGYLKKRGADVDFFVPDRENDGYGISVNAVENAAREGYSLIITVDNGINAIKEVDRANELGVDIVITDHHLPQSELPDAVAVIDPHIDKDCDWLFCDLCGVGVAFKLLCAVEGRPCEEMIYEYGDLVALGTIADVVPLVGENRIITEIGLKLLNRKINNGVRALTEVSSSKYITSLNAAFTLCPRINAAGRMASASTAVKLFLSQNFEDALYYAGLLDGYNSSRQSSEQTIFEEACKQIEDNKLNFDRVIVVSGYNWHVGVIGIVAAKLTEKYAKPCIVINVDGDRSVGSGRSITGFSLFNAIDSCSELLVKFGGHELAAGLTIKQENIDKFRTAINKFAENTEVACPSLVIDCRIKPRAFTVDAVEALKSFEPYGACNSTPLFAVTDCVVCNVNPIASGKHIRLKLKQGDTEFWAVMFGTSAEDFAFKIGSTVDIAVTLDINVYNNTKSVSVVVRAIRKSGIDEDALLYDIQLFDRFKSDRIDKLSAEKICPDRNEIATVFRFVKNSSNVSEDYIVNGLLDVLSYSKIMVALTALCELGIAENKDGKYSLSSFSGKADLESADSLKKLKAIIGGE